MSINTLRLVLISTLALSTPCLLSACSSGQQDDPEITTQAPPAQPKDTPNTAANPPAAPQDEKAPSTDNLEATWRTFADQSIKAYAFDAEKTKQVREITASCLRRAATLRENEKAATSDKQKEQATQALMALNDQLVGRITGLASIEAVVAAKEAGFEAPPLLVITPTPEVGNYAPDFSLTGADGKPVKLSRMRGKTVVLSFWASWCGYCKRALPEIKKVHDAVKDDDSIAIWGINCRFRSGNEEPREYFEKNKYEWDVFLKGDAVANLYEVKGYPTIFVVGPDGKIVFKERGAKAEQASRLLPAIQKAAQKSPPKK